MKRPVYEINVAGRPPVRRNAWNSALRAMETEIRSLMAPGQTAAKEALSIVKLDKWTTGSGTFLWTVSDGRTIEAGIALVSAAVPSGPLDLRPHPGG